MRTSAKGAAEHRQTRKELAGSLGGALKSVPVLREFTQILSFSRARRRGCLYPFLALIVLAAAAWLFSKSLLTALGSALVEDDGPHKADAILVLGGDEAGFRIMKGAQLAQAGYAPYVIVDGPKTLGGYESDVTIKYAEQNGYPDSLFHPLHLPPGVNSTRAESQYDGLYLKQEKIHKILLVTSNYHTHRAASLMRKSNPSLHVVVVPAPDQSFTPNSWWKTREGQKTFLLEWLKTVATWLGM